MPNIFPFYEAEPFWLKRTYGSGGSGDDSDSGGTKLGRLVDISAARSIEEPFLIGISNTYVMIDGRSLSFGEVTKAKAGLTLLYDTDEVEAYTVYAVTLDEENHVASSRRLDDGSLPINYVIPELPVGESLLFTSSIFGQQ